VIPLLCTVRGCGLPLDRGEVSLRCANGHSYDRARSGYVNLLQPQDRRAAQPGDRKEAIAARRRLIEGGYAGALFEALVAHASSLPPESRVLDAGCGEGSHLGRLADRLPLACAGVDIATGAIDLASRRYPGVLWIVANADRRLPFPDGTFDLIVSITARRNAPEFARVLRPGGRLFIAVPAPDDLAELRSAVQGATDERSRVESVVAELAGFALVSRDEVRERRALDRAGLRDLLDATYRGVRRSEQQRAGSLERLDVTFAWDVMVFGRAS
jgi:23S rRNA (guanine745-N1)-methyltransferase